MAVRYDKIAITANRTPEGFVQDTPVVGRVGILTYYNADGSIRREFRPPEEAFKPESLASLKGKPITLGHQAMVNADNAGMVNPIGCVLSEGRQAGDNIVADLIIHNLDTSSRELSCGYTLDLDETPGEYNGQKYDAVQRNIIYNHVAVVSRGRAGNARLNMDGNQLYDEEERRIMGVKIRLDNGLEYEAAPEVAVAYEKLRNDCLEFNKKMDALEAERDMLKAEKNKLEEQLKNKDKEHADSLQKAVKQRVSLLSVAEKHKVEKADEMTDREIKEAVIMAVRGDSIDLKDKSEEYVAAAFDLAKNDSARSDGIKTQRKVINTNQDKVDDIVSSISARERMIKDMQNAYKGGDK